MKDLEKFTEQDIIKGFTTDENVYLTKLYNMYYPVINRFILYNHGDDSDAKDVFQEALMIIMTKIRQNKFSLTCSFKTYLFAICRNLWLKELKIRKKGDTIHLEAVDIQDGDFFVAFEAEHELNAKYFLYRKHFKTLSKFCQKLLRLIIEKIPYNDIVAILDLGDAEIARKKKYRCKEILMERVKKDPLYNQLNNDELE